MCTITAYRAKSSLLVTMNRDEYRTRAPEAPARVHRGGEESPIWVAPVDSQARGTWMGANDRGVVACLTNYYRDDADDAEAPASQYAVKATRGGIIPDLLARGGAKEAESWLARDFDPSGYAPFQLMVFSFDWAQVLTWNPEEGIARDRPLICPASGWVMYSSSFWKPAQVSNWREREFKRWLNAGGRFEGEIPTYHLLHPEGAKEWAPLMSRDLAQTRSITQALINRDKGVLEMRYWPDPMKTAPQTAARIRLRLSSKDG